MSSTESSVMADKKVTVAPIGDLDPERGATPEGWDYCLSCHRCYVRGHNRISSTRLRLCPYSDCSASAVFGSIPWPQVRKEYPFYNGVPRYGQLYLVEVHHLEAWSKW